VRIVGRNRVRQATVMAAWAAASVRAVTEGVGADLVGVFMR